MLRGRVRACPVRLRRRHPVDVRKTVHCPAPAARRTQGEGGVGNYARDPRARVRSQPRADSSAPILRLAGRDDNDWWALEDVIEEAEYGLFSFGQVVRLRHCETGNVLHSHGMNYEHDGTSGQQQITCFGGRDGNDAFRIEDGEGRVNDGDTLRLIHCETNCALHSHADHPSPTTGQQEVTCFDGRDDNDMWRIEYDGDRFRLIHCETDHALHSHGENFDLGNGDEQQEVTCFEGASAPALLLPSTRAPPFHFLGCERVLLPVTKT